jgi:hypothetical protein
LGDCLRHFVHSPLGSKYPEQMPTRQRSQVRVGADMYGGAIRVNMQSSLAILLVACVSCITTRPGPVVSAPASPAAADGNRSASSGGPEACSRPWNLGEVAGGPGSVVVVCGTDARREPLVGSGAVARAISPALEPARERVCACAARLQAPPHVDLVVKSTPDQGRATVEAGDPEDDMDPQLGPPFVACVGTVVVSYLPSHVAACPDSEKAAVAYPFRVDLVP